MTTAANTAAAAEQMYADLMAADDHRYATRKDIEARYKGTLDAGTRDEIMSRAAEQWANKPVIIFRGKNATGLRDVFDSMGVALRYNIRAGCTEWAQEPDAWIRLTDRQAEAWRAHIAEKYRYPTKTKGPVPYTIGRDTFGAWCLAIVGQDGDVDPFMEWLDCLPTWDQKPRIAQLLFGLFTISEEERELAEWIGQYLFMGAVKRTLDPGAKLDESPVLIGGRGIGKTTLTRAVLPTGKNGDAWHGEAASLASNPQRQLEAILGKAIVEIGEMSGASRVEQGEWKRFLSRRVDNSVRLAYARHVEEHPRRCIFVGTADTQYCLPNDPNLRRFVPITLKAKGKQSSYQRIYAYLDRHRQQCWAEALHKVKAGHEVRLPDHLHKQAAVTAEKSRIQDASVADKLDECTTEWRASGHTLSDIAMEIGIMDTNEKYPQKNLVSELRARGWEPAIKKVAGKTKRLWIPAVTR